MNRHLDFNLSLISSWTKVQNVSMQSCSIRGVLPQLGFASSLHTLLLDSNPISGSIRQYPSKLLRIMEISGSRVSATLPPVGDGMESFLANDCRLSGTIPDLSNGSLKHLALARNYFVGDTNGLAGVSDLRTLVLSSNYFECNAVDLNSAVGLGRGSFLEPGTHALKAAGKALAQFFPYIDPFGGLEDESYANIVSAFGGNIQLTVNPSMIPLPSDNATNLMVQDVMIGGVVPLVSG